VDSQSLKTTGVGGEERAYDGGKKVKVRKRHLLLVDAQGLVLEVRVHSAKVVDGKASNSLWILPHPLASPSASLSCGWTRATPEKARAPSLGGKDAGMDG
jgi:hypothetical protein